MTTPTKPLKFQPLSVVFGNNYQEDQKTFLRIYNDTEKVIAYRIRTSRPAFYRMAHSDGILEPGQTKDMEVMLKKNFPWERKEVILHKFIAMTLHPFDEDVREKKSVSEIFNGGQDPKKVEIPLTLHPPIGEN